MEKPDHEVRNAPIVREAVERVPDASTPDRVMVRDTHLEYLRAALAEGLAQADRGELLDGRAVVMQMRASLRPRCPPEAFKCHDAAHLRNGRRAANLRRSILEKLELAPRRTALAVEFTVRIQDWKVERVVIQVSASEPIVELLELRRPARPRQCASGFGSLARWLRVPAS